MGSSTSKITNIPSKGKTDFANNQSGSTSQVHGNQDFILNNRNLLILTFILAALYYFFSRFSEGFYQQDEAGHYLSMLEFWHSPKSILSNWAKPGYKLLYVIPALGGHEMVAIVNCLFAAFSAYFAYKVAVELKSSIPLLAFLLLASQPLWIALSFRNYSEIPSAFLLVLALYAHLKDKHYFSALLVSYLCTIRQEFYPILGMYGLNLIFSKKFVPALLVVVFPLLQNLWGAILYDDPIYLYNQIFNMSKHLGDAYPRQGFDHYFKTAIVVFGPVAVTLFIAYLGATVLQKKQPVYIVLVPTLTYFLINCAFNWQAHPIGPSTGGNLRYMLVISPLLAVLATLGIDAYKTMTDKWKILFVLIPFAVLVAVYMNFKHNYVLLSEERDAKPLVGVMLSMVVLLLTNLKASQRVAAFVGIMLFAVLINVRPMKMSEEDAACRELAKWYKQNEATFKDKQLYLNHIMFYYFLGRTVHDFEKEPKFINSEEISKAQKGSLILWDSHYSYRPRLRANTLNYDYFTQKPDQFNLAYQLQAPDQSFTVLIFEKK